MRRSGPLTEFEQMILLAVVRLGAGSATVTFTHGGDWSYPLTHFRHGGLGGPQQQAEKTPLLAGCFCESTKLVLPLRSPHGAPGDGPP